MKLLNVENMIGIPSAEASRFKAYEALIKRDRTRDKGKAAKELAFIYYLVHWESPYASWDEDVRASKVIKDVFGEDSDWTPDDKVQAAIKLYRSQTENEYVRFLASARSAANKLVDYFDSIDLNEKDKVGKPIHSAKDIISNISKVGEVVEGIDKLKEIIEKNESKKSENRGGVKTNKYSE